MLSVRLVRSLRFVIEPCQASAVLCYCSHYGATKLINQVVAGKQPLGELFHAHFGGQAAHLRLRGSSQFASPVGRSILDITNRMLLWKDLAEPGWPNLAPADWPDGVYSSWLGDVSARLSARVAEV